MIDRDKLNDAIETIRPQLQADGGDVKITEIDDENGIVYVALQGACMGCSFSHITLSQGVERVVKELVPEVKHVLRDPSQAEQAERACIPIAEFDDDGNFIGTKMVTPEEAFGE
ncbi:MAG: NifU family protein [Eggerthellales bacterium]|nr:NifU family protein [Eggerthellales bacterium]